MSRAVALGAILLFLCSCGGGGSSVAPPPPVVGGPTPPPGTITVSEIDVPVNPLYVAADNNGAYFGFGSSGTGSDLYYYSNGTITQTNPAPGDDGYDSGGGVYGIFVTADNVYWLSAYFGNSAQPSVQVECGANGTAALCAPTVDEPTSAVIDLSNGLWVSGLTYAGGGEIRTSAQQAYDSDTYGVLSLIDGPSASVWGVLQSPTFSPADKIVQFAAGASAITLSRQYSLASGSHAGGLTVGGDGRVWFTDFGKSAIGTLTAQGTIHEYLAPHPIDRPSYAQPDIVTDCDGSMWFTESGAGAVARIQTNGKIREIQLPTPDSYPAAIAAPPRTAGTCTRIVWVGEARTQRLAEITY